jgi:ribosomal protein L40E
MPPRRSEYKGNVCSHCGGFKVYYARSCRKCYVKPLIGKKPAWRSKGSKPARSEAERLFAAVSPEPNSGCWLWTGKTVHAFGYVMLYIRRGERRCPSYTAHRLSWELHRGPIPSGMCVLHACDTPACCNPDHLWLGTQQDNLADMHRKGRGRPGRGRTGKQRQEFTAEQIALVRSRASTVRADAARFGVSKSTIHRIRLGKLYPPMAA